MADVEVPAEEIVEGVPEEVVEPEAEAEAEVAEPEAANTSGNNNKRKFEDSEDPQPGEGDDDETSPMRKRASFNVEGAELQNGVRLV